MPEIMIRPFEIDGNINDAFEIISEAFDSFGLSESNGATIAIPCDNSSKSKSDSSDFYDDANTNEFYPETEKKKQETIKEETVKEKADKEKTVDELLAELSVLLKKNPENASEETKEELDKILKSFKNNK